jgi:hypothetical protein
VVDKKVGILEAVEKAVGSAAEMVVAAKAAVAMEAVEL